MSLSIRALTRLIQPPGSPDPRDRCRLKRCKLGGPGPPCRPAIRAPLWRAGLVLPRDKLSKRRSRRLPCVCTAPASRAGLRSAMPGPARSLWSGCLVHSVGLRWGRGRDLRASGPSVMSPKPCAGLWPHSFTCSFVQPAFTNLKGSDGVLVLKTVGM